MSSFERRSRNALAALIGTLAPARKASPEEVGAKFRSGEIRKVLFIRPHQGLGDLLLATPAIRALKKTYPQVEIDFILDTYNHLVLDRNPHLRKIWTWDKKAMRSPLRLLGFLRSLRQQHYDLAFPLASHVPSFTSYLLARLSGARWVCGFDSAPFYDGANWSRWLAHLEIAAPHETAAEFEKFMALVAPFGVSGDFRPEFIVPESDKVWGRERWNALKIPASHRKVVVFLGGNPDRPERLWAPEKWVRLIEGLREDPTISVIAIVPPEALRSGSGSPEKGIYSQVAPKLGAPLDTFSHADLTKVAGFLTGADLFVCPDGGLFHVAVAAGIPTLGLMFEMDTRRWVPALPQVVALQSADRHSSSLGVSEVITRAREMLRERLTASTV